MRRQASAPALRAKSAQHQPHGIPMMHHHQDQSGNKARSLSRGPRRRVSNEAGRVNNSRTYGQIREAHNIPIPGSAFPRQDRHKNDVTTVNTGMSTRKMGNSNGNRKSPAVRPLTSFSEVFVPAAENASSNTKGKQRQVQPQSQSFSAPRRATGGDGGYSSDQGIRPNQRQQHQPPSGRTAPGPGGHRRRRTHEGVPPVGITNPLTGVQNSRKIAGSAVDHGDKFNNSDGNLNYQSKSRPQHSGAGMGLKPLPENQSFRGSNRCFNMTMEEDDESAQDKPLNSMSLVELKAELKQYGVAVDGLYEKGDLINICAQKRKDKALSELQGGPSMEETAKKPNSRHGSSTTSSNDLNNSERQRRARRHSFKSGAVGVDQPRTRSNSLDRASAPPAPGENGATNNDPSGRNATTGSRNNSFGPRRNKSIDDDNPQQGMPSFVTTNGNKNGTTGRRPNTNIKRSDSAPGNINKSRRESSSMSSLGESEHLKDSEHGKEMAVLNAPLGSGLADIGQDIENPNQQMGMLLQQMQQLEEHLAQNPPQVQGQARQEQQKRSQQSLHRKNSGRGAALMGMASSSFNNSRRISADSGLSGFSGGHPSNGSRRLSNGSGRNLSHNGGNLTCSNPRRQSTESELSRHSWNNGTNRSASNHSMRSAAESLNDFMKNSSKSLNASGHPKPPRTPSLTGSTRGMTSMTIASDEAQILGIKSPGSDERRFCSKLKFSKKCILIAVSFALIAGAAVTTTIVLLLKDSEENENGEIGTSTRSNVDQSAPATVPTQSPRQYLQAPPFDIEGRCTPSNLPGSLPACIIACLPAACCYPDYAEDSCIDDTDNRSIEACNEYRPFCDVFFDRWDGAEQGWLRTPPENIVKLCSTGHDIESTAGDVRPIENFARKRHRYHVTSGELRGGYPRKLQREGSEEHHNNDPKFRRKLWTPSTEETCEQYCRSAQCCNAPSYVNGTVLSDSGVITDVASGEHVMTNCQKDDKNELQCSEYYKFCNFYSSASSNRLNGTTDIAPRSESPTPRLPTRPPTSQPSRLNRPSNGLALTFRLPTVSPVVLPRPVLLPATLSQLQMHEDQPSLFPSTEISPSPPVLVPASTHDIALACSGTENVGKISAGEVSSRASCISACKSGLCCFSKVLGYSSWLSPCFDGNEGKCLKYSPCLVLVKEETGGISVTENIATTSNATSDVDKGPPVPTQNLTALCSQESIFTLAGLVECAMACKAGHCCIAQGNNSSCYAEHPEICDSYQPCDTLEPKEQNVVTAINHMKEEIIIPPPAPANLTAVCSLESLGSGVAAGTDCLQLCQPGKCCSAHKWENGSLYQNDACFEKDANVSQATLEKVNDICDTYKPCYNLDLLSPPPNNLNEICTEGNNSTAKDCASICSAVSCCFSGLTSYDDNSNSTNNFPPSCYAHFKDTCNGYAPYCAPPTLEPTASPMKTIPLPPTDFSVLCTFSRDFCKEACKEASCCFEPLPERSCLLNNK
eukprot:CAMPEP_0183713304 /NCGR_PEP_ID=MMETSP0737-20130205/8180_1 /TAXON_ID=385413 /ORGANISM="Thalassiosira miniscula, Strain CCMP1093" /LENGTH=1480 /DNA_ID=CAMNT_0025942067 /DNA_START=132 /DNA_END=4571 /DNA_ORIENTATION=+